MNEGTKRRKALDAFSGDALDEALGLAFGSTLPYDRPGEDENGATIGRYKLLQQIGEGGFGVVYMAEQQEPIRRRVALKVIKLGMDTKQVVARFEAERQALAMMDHENIAAVFDAGATETGRPYFVMELVRGVPITEYCDRNKLTTQQRLKLFVAVCKAVQHAHQKGIIHRDLKPNNVMVTLRDGEPIPKVIDFGVAKATQARLTEKTVFTRYGQFIGTPAYMSPEQVEMSELDVDTRSDIYSLGVLLYELLTGSTPIEREQIRRAAYSDMQRMICEQEPPKPSTRLSLSGKALATISAQRSVEPKKLGQLIRGELDWIVMKSLEKDRTRRFQAAGDLAADVIRYLNNEPVTAGPPTAAYRLHKFIRRNKAILGTVAAFALLLVLGTAFSIAQAVRAYDAEKAAQDERDAVADVRDELLDERRRSLEARRRRQIDRVEALMTTSSESVPVLVKDLRESRETVLPLMRRRFDTETRFENRLRLAIARTLLDDPQLEFLVDGVPNAPAGECANLLRAFRSQRDEARLLLQKRFRSSDTGDSRFRFAVLLLELGKPEAATTLLALKRDPSFRTRFIHAFRDWHGDLAAIPTGLRGHRDSALQSGLGAALGRLDPATISADVRNSIQAALRNVYLTADDGGAHSAAGWALRRWKAALPEIEANAAHKNRRWFVGAGGQTMIVLGNNASNSPDGAGRFPCPFAVSDRETSVALFRRFLSDPKCPPEQKPRDWPGVNKELVPSEDCPVHLVSLADIMLFCNWLSRAEQRQVCYERDKLGRWWCRYGRNGYRLPTVDEWDFACYAGVTSRFPFGNDEFLLPEYGNLLLRRTQPGARLLPNAQGVFDTLGNLWELCHGTDVLDVAANHRQPSDRRTLAMRGGTFGTGSYYLNRKAHYGSGNGARNPDVGFRVVCRESPPTPNGSRPSSQAVIAWLGDRIAVDPDNVGLRVRRANLNIRHRQWRPAAIDYEALVKLQPNTAPHWLRAAALLVQLGETDKYRRVRQAMLKQFRDTNDPLVAERIAKACLLLPDAVAKQDPVARLADKAFSRPTPAWAKGYIQVLRGLVDYRSGRFDAAITTLERNRTAIDPAHYYLKELNLGVLAMAYHASGQRRIAAKLLDEFAGKLDADLADTSGKGLANWHDLLIAHVVRRELKAIISASPKRR